MKMEAGNILFPPSGTDGAGNYYSWQVGNRRGRDYSAVSRPISFPT